MNVLRKPTTVKRGAMAAAIAIGLLLTPALTGCGSNPVETIVEGVTGGNIDIGGTTIPGDFPSEVPLIDGEVISVVGVGKDAQKIWTVMLKVTGSSASEQIKDDLEQAGFTQEFDREAGDASGVAYKNANYGVLVAVTEDGNNGWVATYIVTPIGS